MGRLLERMSLNDLKTFADQKRQEWATAKAAVAKELSLLARAESELDNAAEAQGIVQDVAAIVQEKAHSKLAGVVSQALAFVFDNPYGFEIRFDRKRGKTEARMVFTRDGHEINPKKGSGIGAVDVAAFALRLICLAIQRPKRRKLLVLDEPFKNVNGTANRERTAELVQALAQQYGVQIVMVTGYDWLRIGKVVKL